jgi:hypothetical protein
MNTSKKKLRLSIAEVKITPLILKTYEYFRSDKNAARKRDSAESNNMEKQKKHLQISQRLFQLTLREKSDSLGEANFIFVTTYHIIA